jgi:hypothetical protein
MPPLTGTDAEKEAIYLKWAQDLAHLSRQELAVGAASLKLRMESGVDGANAPTSAQFIAWCNPIHVIEKNPPRRAKNVHACADLRWAHKIMKRHEAKDKFLPAISVKWAKEVLGRE